MEMQKKESSDELTASGSFATLDRLFYPRAVAVVGITPRRQYPNRFFLDSMKDLGFQGPVYGVNSTGEAIDEFIGYKRLMDIPGPVEPLLDALKIL